MQRLGHRRAVELEVWLLGAHLPSGSAWDCHSARQNRFPAVCELVKLPARRGLPEQMVLSDWGVQLSQLLQTRTLWVVFFLLFCFRFCLFWFHSNLFQFPYITLITCGTLFTYIFFPKGLKTILVAPTDISISTSDFSPIPWSFFFFTSIILILYVSIFNICLHLTLPSPQGI